VPQQQDEAYHKGQRMQLLAAQGPRPRFWGVTHTHTHTQERFKKSLTLKYNIQANKGCRRQSVSNVPVADHGEETRKEEQEAVSEGVGDCVASADGKLEAVKLEAVKLEAIKLEVIKLEAGAIEPVVKLEAVKLEAGAIEPVVKRGRQA